MANRRQFLSISISAAAASLSGCIKGESSTTETQPSEDTDASPDYDVSVECSDKCEFTITLNDLGTAEYVLVEPSLGSANTLDTENSSVTVTTESESISVYAVRGHVATLVGTHEYRDNSTETEISANPQAGVTLDQTRTGDTYEVEVMVISMEHADYVEISSSKNPDNYVKLDRVGDSTTLTDLREGDTVTVVGAVDGKKAIIQTYTVE